MLFTLAYEFVYDENARPGLRERPWFYGLQGTPNRAIETDEAIFDFENKIGGEVLLAFRQSQLSEIEARTPVIIGKLEWPETFVTSGVLEVRREKFGIYIVLRRGHDYEGGVLLLGKESYRYAIEQDPTYLRGKLWESGVYHYFRKWKK